MKFKIKLYEEICNKLKFEFIKTSTGILADDGGLTPMRGTAEKRSDPDAYFY